MLLYLYACLVRDNNQNNTYPFIWELQFHHIHQHLSLDHKFTDLSVQHWIFEIV